MKKRILILAVLFFSSLSVKAAIYKLDPQHLLVGFDVTHMVISSVHGQFKKVQGQLDFNPQTGELKKVEAKIDVDSLDTNEPKRDHHLKSPDFFGVRDKKGQLVSKNRYMTFKSTKITHKGKTYQIHGLLTLKGHTKPVVLTATYKGHVKDPWGNERIGFAATGQLNRKDFGLTWNKVLETGGLVVGNEVSIKIQGEAIKSKGQ
ncbi:MAG: polyisoprenoid-binding protein [Bdellovibrio sp.]|nr:MAG: polyisoprenoid-binding protein [Bdellovibrio sp.]